MSLPRNLSKHQKGYWNQSLSLLKRESINSHNLWLNAGSPLYGDLYLKKKESCAIYKKELRTCQSQWKKS